MVCDARNLHHLFKGWVCVEHILIHFVWLAGRPALAWLVGDLLLTLDDDHAFVLLLKNLKHDALLLLHVIN